MRQRVGQIDHVIWACAPEALEENGRRLADLYDVRFDGPWDNDRLGIRVLMCWSVGLEIIAPLAGAAPFAEALRAWLDGRGAGVYAVVFGVSDIERWREHAAGLGYAPGPVLEQMPGTPWADQLAMMREVVAGDVMNTLLAYGEIGLN